MSQAYEDYDNVPDRAVRFGEPEPQRPASGTGDDQRVPPESNASVDRNGGFESTPVTEPLLEKDGKSESGKTKRFSWNKKKKGSLKKDDGWFKIIVFQVAVAVAVVDKRHLVASLVLDVSVSGQIAIGRPVVSVIF